MKDGSRLGRNDDSMLVEILSWELDVPLLFLTWFQNTHFFYIYFKCNDQLWMNYCSFVI
jgi:hypothetical protein